MYRVKEKKEEVQSTIDSKKIKANIVVQIGNIKVTVNDVGTRPMVFDKSVNPYVQRPIMDNDHEASNSNSTSKYFQLRWCPPGLTYTQRRKLQRLRAQEKKDQEFKRLRDKQFNNYRPMVPQGKVWRVKVVDQPARPVESPQAIGLTGTSDRSDRPEQPVRSVEVSTEQIAELAMPVSVPCDGETPLAFSVRGNEELVDHEATPKAQQYGAQRHLSTRGAKYWQLIIYLMKFLYNRSICKGRSRL